MSVKKDMIVGGVFVSTVAAVATMTILNLSKAPPRYDLMGDNFFMIRRQALDMFPRGSRLVATTERLVALGFRCIGTPHKMPNVNAESLVCDSHGRGYPKSPALNITVMARNGMISDIEVWNIMQKADATTPEPKPQPVHEAVAEAKGPGAHAE